METNKLVVNDTSASLGTFTLSEPTEQSFHFPLGDEEMIRVTKDSFFVRGVKIKQDEHEAKIVYKAFKELLGFKEV